MLFTAALRSKLVSLLRPWLEDEPELDLRLGLLSSSASVKSLVFNPSFLNPSIEKSTRLEFKRFEVGELRVRVSPWSSPSLVLEARGIHVTLAPRETSGDRRTIPSDLALQRRKETIASIDPEGAYLHEIIGKVSVWASSGNWLMTSLVDAMVRHCQIQLDDIHLKLQYTETHGCLLEISDFSLKPQLLYQRSLLRGLIGVLFASGKETILSISCNSVDFGLKENDDISSITSLMTLSAFVKLDNLQPRNYSIRLSNADLKLSPIFIPVFMVLSSVLSPEGVKGIRNGQELWKIAREKIGWLTLHKVGNTVVLWSRYVRAYELLLLLVGYSVHKEMKENLARLSSDNKLLSRVKYQWSSVCELEEHLPAEAVARARRIARHRLLLYSDSVDLKPSTGFVTMSLLKILSPLFILWRAIYMMLHSIVRLCFMWDVSSVHNGVSRPSFLFLPSSSSDYEPQLNLSLNLEELCITYTHSIAGHAPIDGKIQHGSKLPQLKLPSFCLIIRSSLLIYALEVSSKSFFAACEELKLYLSSSSRVSKLDNDLIIQKNPSFKGLKLDTGIESKVVLWCDPAQQFHPSERVAIDSSNPIESTPILVLENYIEDLWSSWKTTRVQCVDIGVQLMEQPFVICDMKNFLVDPYLSRGDYGLWKGSFTLGKLNFDLDYSSTLSILLLLGQMQNDQYRTTRTERTYNLACSSSVFEVGIETEVQNWINLYTSKMKTTLLSVIPDKSIQVGALIAGLNVRISLQRDQLFGATEQDLNPIVFSFDLANIEFVVWPTARSTLAALTGDSSFNEAVAEYLWLKEPRTIEASEAHLNERFISQGRVAIDAFMRFNGLDAFVNNLELNQKCHVAEFMPVIIQSSTCRDYLHSLSPIVDALSMSLTVVTTGTDLLLHMDKLCTFLQVIQGMLSGVSSFYVSFEPVSPVVSQDSVRNLIPSTENSMQNSTTDAGATGCTLISRNTQFFFDASLQLMSVNIIFNDSLNYHDKRSSKKPCDTFSTSMRSLSMLSTRSETVTPDKFNMPRFGIGVFIKKSCFQISGEEYSLDMLIDLCGIQSDIFDCRSLTGDCSDILLMKGFLNQPHNHLYQFALSKCIFSSHVGSRTSAFSPATANRDGLVSGSYRTLYALEKLPSDGEDLMSQSYVPDQKLRRDQLLSGSTPGSPSVSWILAELELGEIFLAEHSMMNLVIGSSKTNALKVLMSVCEELDTIKCNIQGGYIFIESAALAMFINCFKDYFLLIMKCFNASGESSRESGNSNDTEQTAAGRTNQLNDDDVRESVSPTLHSGMQKALNWNFFKALTVDLSQFSLILAVTDGSGGAQELILEVDTSLHLLSFGRKLLLDLNRLTIFTNNLWKKSLYQKRDPLMPHFRPDKSGSSSSYDSSINCTSPELHDAHSRSSESLKREVLEEIGLSEFSPSNHGSYILKHLTASITIEKTTLDSQMHLMQLKSDWFGTGCISGFDLTTRISEIQMLSALYAPLSGIFGTRGSHNLKQKMGSRTDGWSSGSDYTIPDGAIVAIQDLHQHMYFAVEAVDVKYCIVGALHYSLAGERALFRVKYHKKWRSGISWISFISLYAKSKEGTPLRLNLSPQSGYVEIASSDDNGWALWQTRPCNSDTFEGDDVGKSYDIYTAKAFHLLNQKNDCGVAFVDGLPESVKKPGNPFKIKVFKDFPLMNDMGSLDVISAHHSNLPLVNITFDKIVLTILHEVSDANDGFPLIQGCINDISIAAQILSSKFRIISSCNIAIHYFDVQRNLWKEIISPVNICLFYRSRFTDQDSVSRYRGVPVHFYFRMRQVDIFLTEISLDVLLYLAGKLDIAGPFAVKSSMIFPNCCKIENHSGLSVLCQFADDQEVKIAGKKSASILLRHVPPVDKHQESESLVSVCFTEGHFSTSPINVSLLKDHVFAWRARILSLQDARSFPGPFVVVEVSKTPEAGLSLIVSPLLRIHNESRFSMELCFRRPQETEEEFASTLLKHGDTIDDSMAVFDALDLSGGSKKTLMSLTLGNFLLSVRPEITKYTGKTGESFSVNWSDALKGGKAVRISGIFDTLNYKFRKAFGVDSGKSFFSSLHCPLFIGGQHVSDVYFLVQTIGRNVPVMLPPDTGETSDSKNLPVIMQMQKEIFIYPTVQVHNILQAEIHVLLSEARPDMSTSQDRNVFGREAVIPCGSSAYFYANPASIYFTISLTAHNSTCKPVDSGDWVKKLPKQKSEVHYLDTTLDFGGKFCASLRLSRADRGILEATIFTAYTLKNDTEFSLFASGSNQKSLPRTEDGKYSSDLPPEFGCFLPPNSIRSWFLKSNKVHFKWIEDKATGVSLDLDILSGFTEISLEAQNGLGVKHRTKLGVSVQPCMHKICVPSQLICIVPRYVIHNESNESILVRQCYLEDDMCGATSIGGKQKAALQFRNYTRRRGKTSFFDSLFKGHRNVNEDSQIYVEFCPEEIGYSWSGPICAASFGRFFLKFKRNSPDLDNQSNPTTRKEERLTQFAEVDIVEENSSLVLQFYMPPNVALPYRIENSLHGLSILYYQKESIESDVLGFGGSVEYVWDDLSLPHMLIVQIVDMHLLREINIDKICAWKPFFKMRQNKGMVLHLPSDKRFGVERKNDETDGLKVFNVGYEVYADGLTRVLRICELPDRYKEEKLLQPCVNFQFRLSYLGIHLLEYNEQDVITNEAPIYSTIIVARFANITFDSLITEQYKYNSLLVQAVNVDEKWQGAPFASMVRRSQLNDFDSNESILRIIFILHSTSSNVKQVKNSSIILQPIDLKIDEETLMRLVPFWRTSLSDSRTQSQQFYFKHFEIHPIKIIATFLPGTPHSSYSSAQEALRSLLHSVIKVPAINNSIVELNGVLLTHALLTFCELLIKCAQHYSWYVVRAVYKAKGSPLLPPAFASIFDDTASSSLDVFFDPSDGSVNLPGLTVGMFKFISKCIDSNGFSGTKRYFGDLGKVIKTASSNALFAAVTEITDNVLRGAETSGFNGMVNGFNQGILRLAMEPSVLGAALMEGGPDRKIKLDRSPGVDELYIEGYLQAMLDMMYKQEYLRVRVIDNQVVLKNLPPNSHVINDIVENVKIFLVSKALLKGDNSVPSRPWRQLRRESDWKLGPTVLTLCEHLFVSFAIRMLRKQANKFITSEIIKWRGTADGGEGKGSPGGSEERPPNRRWAVGKFILSGMVAYLDGRLCRHIPNPIARRIVSGFLLSFLDKKDGE